MLKWKQKIAGQSSQKAPNINLNSGYLWEGEEVVFGKMSFPFYFLYLHTIYIF